MTGKFIAQRSSIHSDEEQGAEQNPGAFRLYSHIIGRLLEWTWRMLILSGWKDMPQTLSNFSSYLR